VEKVRQPEAQALAPTFDFRSGRPHLVSMANQNAFRRFVVHSGQLPARA
jgi:hypothetical protein